MQLSLHAGVVSLEKASYAVYTIFIPSSCGIFVHRLITTTETRITPLGSFIFSTKSMKSERKSKQAFAQDQMNRIAISVFY